MNGLPVSAQLAPLVVSGAKTQTRRLSGLEAVNASPDDWDIIDECLEPDESWVEFCCPGKGAMHDLTCRPRYHVGQRLAMLTTWATIQCWDHKKPSDLDIELSGKFLWHAGMSPRKPLCQIPPLGKSRPGRFLPNALRPLMPQIEITGVKCERLNAISEADAIAEGIRAADCWEPLANDNKLLRGPQWAFSLLWDSVSPKMTWAFNPWVFCYSFRVLPKPEASK